MPTWVHLVAIGVLFLTIFGLGFKSGYDTRASKVPGELADQLKKDNESCNGDKKLTTEVQDDDQKRIDALDAELVRVKLRYASAPARCTPVYTTGSIKAGASGELRGSDDKPFGVSTEALLTYAGDAERMRLQVMACQDFINKVWSRPATR